MTVFLSGDHRNRHSLKLIHEAPLLCRHCSPCQRRRCDFGAATGWHLLGHPSHRRRSLGRGSGNFQCGTQSILGCSPLCGLQGRETSAPKGNSEGIPSRDCRRSIRPEPMSRWKVCGSVIWFWHHRPVPRREPTSKLMVCSQPSPYEDYVAMNFNRPLHPSAFGAG